MSNMQAIFIYINIFLNVLQAGNIVFIYINILLNMTIADRESISGSVIENEIKDLTFDGYRIPSKTHKCTNHM